tara:strand:+ start:272 stop:1750 length:1479 start_codon:yes stop_codon:yes gene_type:complete
MINPAPVRVPRQSTLNSPLVKAANKIVTSPTFNKVKSIDFDKKHEYEKFIRFIESSNNELLKINLPKSKDIKSDDDSGGGGGGLGLLASLLLKPIVGKLALTAMKLARLLKGLKNLIPRGLRLRLRRWWRNRTMRFRQLGRFFRQLPGKIINWGRKKFNQVKTFIRKNFDEAILGIKNFLKNLKNSKFVQNILSKANKLKTIADDAFKVGKEVVTNNKFVRGATEILERVGKKVGGKVLSTTLGELSVIGGVAADLSMAAYRFKKGDVTGGLLSTVSALPVVGIPFALVDIARDLGAFEEGSKLDKLDRFNLFRLNKDNPNYVDKRTDKEKEIDAEVDKRLMDIYKKDLEKQKAEIENSERLTPNMKIKRTKDLEKEIKGLGELTSTQLRNKVSRNELLVEPLPKSYNNENFYGDMEKFLENLKPEVNFDGKTSLTIIQNGEQFILPFDATKSSKSISGSNGLNINFNTNIIDINSDDNVADDLLLFKLDKN